jgi:hypothetical protein
VRAAATIFSACSAGERLMLASRRNKERNMRKFSGVGNERERMEFF